MFDLQHNYASLGASFSSKTNVQPLAGQQLIHSNLPLAKRLGIDFSNVDVCAILSGEADVKDSLSMVYAGHQFGGLTPQLGDGRGVLLGEVLDDDGLLNDLHMKGAGLTPYSRQGDGRAVLRSCIREYLASEAMFALNVSTSRALALYTSDEVVYREQPERGAMLLRTAKTHIRFGHFEFFFYRNKQEELNLLIDYCLTHYFPHCKETETPIVSMLEEVVERTALMIAKWQALGFQHGVMNTDNMSLLGETIDYGPYEFMGEYDPRWICNHSDYEGRYAFERQPGVALWNLNCLIHCFSKHLSREQLVSILDQYEPKLIQFYQIEMRAKLGLQQEQEGDRVLLASLFSTLEKAKTDYTIFFRALSNITESADQSHVLSLFEQQDEIAEWMNRYIIRRQSEEQDWQQVNLEMLATNPKFILRNYLAQTAIMHAEKGDFSYFKKLLETLATPFDEQEDKTHLAQQTPDWGKELVISCSS